MNKIINVAIVGRTNVGKSTLFNRLLGFKKAITSDREGVTRDFIKHKLEWQNKTFNLIDTGGIVFGNSQDIILSKVKDAAVTILEDSDLILFVVDGTTGVLPEDLEISKLLHRLKKEVLLVINKSDSGSTSYNQYEFTKLGFAKQCLISAQHGTAISDVLDFIVGNIRSDDQYEQENPDIKVVLLGKPNVGKSSLMNKVLNKNRSIVSNIPGTTREAISDDIKFYNQTIMLTDTAGVRRQKSIKDDLESMMVKSTFAAVKDSDVVLLLLDIQEGKISDQELKLAFFAFSSHYKAVIILINKIDLSTDFNKHDLEYNFEYYKHFIKKVPVLKISCLTGENLNKILPLVNKICANYQIQFDDNVLDRLFKFSLIEKPLYHSREKLEIYKVKQIKSAPPTVLLTVNEPDWFGESQLNFFENILRENYDLKGVPVKFVLKKATY